VLAGLAVPAAQGRFRFTEVAASSGLTLLNVAGTATKDFLPEANGNGVALFDYDNDRDLDVLLVNGSTFRDLQKGGTPMVALYRNDGKQFTDVTEAAGLTRRGWGSGVCVADFDNDGFEDVYITAFGPNVLWRNVGGRTFSATKQASDPRWSTGCAFGDHDRDGDVDLYVANYVRFVPGKVPPRGTASCAYMNLPTLCGPRPLPGEPDTFYRNDGNGTFTNATKAAGIVDPGHYGFGVVFSDLDDDGWPDIYVANDSTPNLFFVNLRDGTFSERGLQSGLSVSADGREQAGMGVDVGDYDGDGRLDIIKTNFAQDYTSLYRNEGNGLFLDVSYRSGLAATLGPSLGWGVGFADFDNDALPDVFIANGHIYPDIEKTGSSTYRQRNHLFRNLGKGRFRSVAVETGGPLLLQQSSRGAAFGDVDNDGDIDILISVIDDRPMLLRNDSTGGHWVTLRLEGTKSNRLAIGAKVTIETGSRRQVAEVRSGASYISHNDTRVHFGLGTGRSVDRVTIRWPNGNVETLGSLAADRFYVVREGEGVRPGT
jgi:hypothetical protein